MIESNKDIGQIIRKLRKEKSLSMKQLGSMVGVSEQAISQYELGKRKLTAEQAKQIAAALGVPKGLLLADLNDVVEIENKLPSQRTEEEQAIYNYFVKSIPAEQINNNREVLLQKLTAEHALDDFSAEFMRVYMSLEDSDRKSILDHAKFLLHQHEQEEGGEDK
ncbi:helix-turn-helix domain-containing protein [Faecalispora jeddahensis]|uniref:helix-turn-helix domain-containing protein n=1 Tax=Faecalispora jeddahensis TaxID=1414721 RepID=UPI0027B92E99|nr:helix-turn-helix transcriptional regulator [Faecalispora jeddahensis]